MIPEAEKPEPETATALIVTGTLPVDVSVAVCVAFVFTFTLPKLRLDALAFSVAVAPVSCSPKVCETPLALEVSVTDCEVLTAVTVAVKLALEAPAATVTEAGTVTAVLLLARFTPNPPVDAAAAFSVTVQLSVPAPVNEPFAQVSPASTGRPVPLRLTIVDVPDDELLVSVNEPDAAPAMVGSNCIVSVAVCPLFNVSGKVAPETLKPAPRLTAEFTVTGAVPVDDKVMVCVVGVSTETLPKFTLDGFTLNVGTLEPSSIRKVSVTPAALAVRVAAELEVTEETVAEKLALDAPAGIVTEAGTVTAALLLARPTAKPPVPAFPFSVTVQISVPAPVIEPSAQLSPFSTETPVPLRLTTSVVPVDESSVIVNVPAYVLAFMGLKFTVNVAVWPAFSVRGNVAPERL